VPDLLGLEEGGAPAHGHHGGGHLGWGVVEVEDSVGPGQDRLYHLGVVEAVLADDDHAALEVPGHLPLGFTGLDNHEDVFAVGGQGLGAGGRGDLDDQAGMPEYAGHEFLHGLGGADGQGASRHVTSPV
jgi:hypothetical protein